MTPISSTGGGGTAGVAAPAAEPELRADYLAAPNLAPPPGNPRFPEFDGLRALAALSVFLGHTVTGTISPIAHRTVFVYAAQLAIEGVAIFFVISGFLLYRPFRLAQRRGRAFSLRGYARRRLARIVPAYWVALTIFVLAAWVPGVHWGNWWVFYGFAQVYRFSTIGQGLGAAWTLCTEMAFYVALPLIAMVSAVAARRGGVRAELALLGVLSVASLAFRWHFRSFSDIARVDALPGMFGWFALGMALAAVSASRPEAGFGDRPAALLGRWGAACWAAAAALFLVLEALIHVRLGQAQGLVSFVLGGLVAALVVTPGVFGGAPIRFLRRPWLVWLGLISYSFYLYHTVIIAQIAHRLDGISSVARWMIVLPVSFLLSCLAAAASYYLIERPVLRRASRRRN